MSHSVHLKAPPPDAGPFFDSRSAHHRAALIQIRAKTNLKRSDKIEDR